MQQLKDELPLQVNRLQSELFIHDTHGICFLKNPSALFGAIQSVAQVNWGKGNSAISQSNFFEELCRTAPNYESVQTYPHYPLLPGVYYEHGTPEPGNKLDDLLARFCPATELDRLLLTSALLTTFSGGTQRPIFCITNQNGTTGQGIGKTSAVQALSRVTGGCLMFKASELDTFTKRYYSNEGRSLRCALVDNVKAQPFESDTLEAYATTDVISGHKMFVGEARVRNMVTWFMTLNGATLGRDLAQRCVLIQLAKGRGGSDWLNDIQQFIEQHRMAIIGDAISILQRDSADFENPTRWASWENAVLAKLPHAQELQELILQRQEEADSDTEWAETVEGYIADQLGKLIHDPDEWCGLLPSKLVAQWISEATNEHHSATKVASALRKNPLPRLTKAKSNKYGVRCYIWREGSSDIASRELLEAATIVCRCFGD